MNDPGPRRLFRVPAFLRRHVAEEVDDELAFHLAMRAARLQSEGLSDGAAAEESLRRFGDLDSIRTECVRAGNDQLRRDKIMGAIDAARCDLRFAIRTLRRSPLFAAASVLSLALAIGATVATFMIVDGLLLRPAPWAKPGELFLVQRYMAKSGEIQRTWSQPRYEELRRLVASDLPQMASFARRSVTLSAPAADSGIRADAEFVSPSYLRVVGVAPLRGRMLDTAAAASEMPSVVISARLERSMFPRGDAVGRTIRANAVSFVIVGVMPEGFLGLSGTGDLWMPLTTAPAVWGNAQALSQYMWAYQAVARVPATWTAGKRDAILHNVGSALGLGKIPELGPESLRFVSAANALTDPGLESLLWILLGAAACVLVLACANVASLSIAKLTARQTELAVRTALGASSLRLAGSLLTEAALIAAAGTALGVLCAGSASRVLWLLRPTTGGPMAQQLAASHAPSFDVNLSVFIACVFVVTIALIGLWPWLEIRRPLERRASLGLGGHTAHSGGRRERRLRGGLSVVQLALAFSVTMSAVLFVASYGALTRLDHGFSPRDLLTLRVDLPATRYNRTRATELYRSLLQRLASSPGIVAADIANALPLDGSDLEVPAVIDPSLPPGKGGRGMALEFHAVGPAHFRALGVVAAGVQLDRAQPSTGDVPVVISRATARAYWPDRSPIGQSIAELLLPGFDGKWKRATVIGVVPDIQYGPPGTPPAPAVYASYVDAPPSRATLMIRTSGSASTIAANVRAVMRGLDPQLVLYDMKSMQQRVDAASSSARFAAFVLAAYAIVALLIALIGVYSVIAFGVAQRRAEFGIRVALGATPGRILSAVLGAGMRIIAAGIAVGALGSIGARRVIGTHLLGATAADSRYYGIVLAAFALAGLAACALPARSATRVDPSSALRN